jgi:hypothetical protein
MAFPRVIPTRWSCIEASSCFVLELLTVVAAPEWLTSFKRSDEGYCSVSFYDLMMQKAVSIFLVLYIEVNEAVILVR